MILIISIEQDESTIDIIRWLHHLGEKYILLNNNELIDNISIDINTSDVYLTCSGIKINFKEIKSVWYRRGNFKIDNASISGDFVSDKINDFLKKENNELYEYLHYLLNEKYTINNYNYKKVNKLIVLTMARDLGLDIPETLITNSKTEVETSLKKGDLITKAIRNPINFYGDTYWLPNYTTVVDEKNTPGFNDIFGTSLFQKQIPKKIEIRSYMIEKELHSMAIFSQTDEQTIVDFRKYNNRKPNRNVPYQLPEEIGDKLKRLALQLNLNSCSFDLIYTPSKKYIFLEVNPIGQFGMVSYPCNYQLEKKIAQKLAQYDI
ncbi:grasp-with-spasm system ATP-grasp peptide maturase [Aquimarina sp. 2201CG5-10]|uniref:grasp-with-spasm system ATP-grasp peptide maturase n=1 Tax=Aquimarina callyspongiae TaxID=3098150 RepID=UPI002AB4B54F|nr:grasp-with-spasm system ATP-grasp peptide maturase [Aquimarina sp. 2201CG5-10]MDY8136437.1 grasp-with-spasm system ATP-grasp peptide maturase [Aquimarina sp. 2201CG5-10]